MKSKVKSSSLSQSTSSSSSSIQASPSIKLVNLNNERKILKTENDNNNGLTHKQCLEILFEQINDLLDDYKCTKANYKLIAKHFFLNNLIEFIHNFLIIFLCSIGLFVLNSNNSEYER